MVKLFGKPHIHWTPEEVAKIVELHKSGKTPTELAERFGTSKNSINGVLHRAKKARTE